MRMPARRQKRGERRNIFTTARKGGPRSKNADAIPEIFAERAARDHVAQVAMRRGDDAHIDACERCRRPVRTCHLHDAHSRTCASSGSSAISSRTACAVRALEPSFAHRNRALKLPFSWPNSSESMIRRERAAVDAPDGSASASRLGE